MLRSRHFFELLQLQLQVAKVPEPTPAPGGQGPGADSGSSSDLSTLYKVQWRKKIFVSLVNFQRKFDVRHDAVLKMTWNTKARIPALTVLNS